MSLKILCDVVLTAAPDKCSTNVIFRTAVERLLEVREDVFVYWLVPDYLTDEEKAWYPQDSRIKYMPTTQSKDRVREYLTLPQALYEACTFYGPCWDFDILLTMRTGLVPQMRLLMNSPRMCNKWWLKEVWLIDVMPCLKFKVTVPQMVPEVHDRWTLAGYQAADRVWVVSYYEPLGIRQAARQMLPPSQAMAVSAKIRTGVTAQFDQFELKPEGKRFTSGQQRPFGLSFIGRMEKANGIEDINAAMEKAWILRGDNVKNIVCTVSKVVKTFDEELVDVRFPPREEFWKIVRNEVDAFIYVSREAAISLSALEPLMLGTPCITIKDAPRVMMFGDDYPLYSPGVTDTYGVFKALYDDYSYWYGKFAKWHEEWFRPTWKKRFEDDLVYPQIVAASYAFEQKLKERLPQIASMGQNQTVLDLTGDLGDEGVIPEVLKEAGTSKYGVLAKKADLDEQAGRNLTFMSPFNAYRIGLKLFHQYEDASVELGHLKKVS